MTDHLASYLSLCPSSDAVLSFGPMDMLLAPAKHYQPTRLCQLYPHPAQDASEKRRYVAALASRNATARIIRAFELRLRAKHARRAVVEVYRVA